MSESAIAPTNDFQEFEHLKAKSRHWKTESDKSASDCTLVVESDAGHSKVYQVHLRDLSGSADLFYRIAVAVTPQSLCTLSTVIQSDLPREGDIELKLQDGSSFSIGCLSNTICSLKEQIQAFLGILAADQRLFPCHCSIQDTELVDDWRSLAACGLSKGDTLLLMRRQWLQYDPSSRTLKMKLPDPCSRCISPLSLRLLVFSLTNSFMRLPPQPLRADAMYRFCSDSAGCFRDFAEDLPA